jgi:hypothetical protein
LDFFSLLKTMKFESSIFVTNSSGAMLLFHLEPWGEQIEMPVGATFQVIAEADRSGSFEVEHLEREVIIWAWPSAVVKVFSKSQEVGNNAGVERPAVPPVPEGQRVSSFLRSVLGKDGVV